MIPPGQSAAFVARMEEVLDLYCLPYDAEIPLVCMDEQPVQLVKETRLPIPVGPGRPARVDYEYERAGTANVFMFVEPLGERRIANIRERKTSEDWAHEVKDLLDVHYPDAARIRLVMDNLNTHGTKSLYETFPAEEARRLARRLEIHHTPPHGSWLNMAEIELSVLTQQCLDRRIPNVETLRHQVKAWECNRNGKQKGVKWRFTTEDARVKLRRLYPQIQMD